MSASPKILILEQFMQYSSYVARNCYYIDKVNQKYNNKLLGVCIAEVTRDGRRICYFQKPFRGLTWQHKDDIYIK